MITFSKFFEATIEQGKRILKVNQYGVKTADESAPFGMDSNPIKGMTAIYADTSNDSESVIIGYINENQIAQKGETRIFSLDENGNLKAFIWCKNNGEIHLNGNTSTAVKFEELKTAINNSDTLLNTELTKIQTAISALGGTYVKSNVTTNIDPSKSDKVKLV